MTRRRSVLVAVTAAVVGPEGAGLPPVTSTDVGERLMGLVAGLPADQRRLLSLGLFALQWTARARYGRAFDRLDQKRACHLLSVLADGRIKPLRRLVHVLKLLTQFAYFAGPETWEAVGYDGPWLGRVDVAVAPPPRIGKPAP